MLSSATPVGVPAGLDFVGVMVSPRATVSTADARSSELAPFDRNPRAPAASDLRTLEGLLLHVKTSTGAFVKVATVMRYSSIWTV